MKKNILILLWIISSLNLTAQTTSAGGEINQQAKPPTAYYDAVKLYELLSKGNTALTSADSATIYKIIISFVKNDGTPIQPRLNQSFDPRVVSIVTQHLARIDTGAIGNYTIVNWGKFKQTPPITKEDFQKILQARAIDFPDRQASRDLLLKSKFNMPLAIAETSFGSLLSLQTDINTLKAKFSPLTTDSAKNNNQTIKTTIAAKLAASKVDSVTLPKEIDALKNYIDNYKKIAADNAKINNENLTIWAVFNSLKQEVFNQYYLDPRSYNIDLSPTALTTGVTNTSRETVLTQNETTSLTSFKLPSESELVDALAIYMVKRLKQDGVLNFIDLLRRYAVREPLLTDMFPSTFKLLNDYPDYETPRFGKIWTHAIAEDLANMPHDVLKGEFIKKLKITGDQKYQLFNDIVLISQQVAMKTPFPTMVSYFVNDTSQLRNPYIINGFNILNMIDREFVAAGDKTRYWIDWNELNNLNPDELQLFLGLLNIQYPEVFNNFTKSFNSDDKSYHAEIRNYFSKILIVLNSFQTSKQEYLNLQIKDPKTTYTGISFWDMQMNLFEIIEGSGVVKTNGEFNAKYLTIAKCCTNIYKEIEDKNYAAMVHETLNVITILVPKTSTYGDMFVNSWQVGKEKFQSVVTLVKPDLEKIDAILSRSHQKEDQTKDSVTLNNIIEDLYSKSKDNKLISRLLACSDKEDFKKAIKKLYETPMDVAAVNLHPQQNKAYYVAKFAEFFTDMLAAKNSQEMANVIGTYAAPPNSFKIKRSTRASISINSYIGTYFGGEYAPTLKPVFGLTAPIGISFNWGFQKHATQVTGSTFIGGNGQLKDLVGSSFSINFSVIDIGAVVSYRINNGDDGALPKNVNFGQFLSPGLSFSYGIRNVPLCFSLGTEFTPELRSLTISIQQHPAVRIYAGLFYDLPFSNISKR